MPAPATPKPNSQRFARYLRRAALNAGYDIDTPRSGATKALAAASGLPQSTISRALGGEVIPHITTFQPLADTLDVPVVQLLIEAELITPPVTPPNDTTPETTPTPPTPPVPSPQTPAEAADELGIHPADRPLFIAIVKRFTGKGDNR